MGRWDWVGLAALSGAVVLIAGPDAVLAQQTGIASVIREARLDDPTVRRDKPGSSVDAAGDPTAQAQVRRSKARAATRNSYAARNEAARSDVAAPVSNVNREAVETLRGTRPLGQLSGPVPPARSPTDPFIVSGGGITIVLDGHFTRARVPTLSGGTQFDPVLLREVSIVKSPRILNGEGATGALSVPLTGGAKLFGRGGYDRLDSSASGSVPIGGNNVAQTYIFPNPVSGSTGIAAGATGQSVRIQTEGRFIDATGGAMWERRLGFTMFGLPVIKEKGFGFHYRNFDRQDTITQQSLAFSDLNSVIKVDTSANFYAAHFVGGLKFEPEGLSGYIGGTRGTLSLGVLNTDASASQTSHCGPCGAASPEVNVNLRSDFNESKFTWAAGVSAYGGYQFNPSMKMILQASYEYMDKTPVFSVPTTPVQQPGFFDHISAHELRFGGSFVYSFAPPQ